MRRVAARRKALAWVWQSRTYFERYCGHLPPDPESETFKKWNFKNQAADTLCPVQH
jgi:hypothetical protein